MDPVTIKLIAEAVIAIVGLLALLFGVDKETIKKIKEFLERLAGGVENVATEGWLGLLPGIPDDDDDDDKDKGLCYLATKTYKQVPTEFYVVKKCLPGTLVRLYYKIGGPMSRCRYIPRVTFLPLLEGIRGII